MDAQAKVCFVDGLRSIAISDAGVSVVADCLHVSGAIRDPSAVDAEKQPISDPQEAA